MADADQWASVVRLSDDEAALLQVAPDQPALLFQRLTRDPSGVPVEYVRSLYRGDRYEVHTRLERLSG
jgi:GntR family transcriptional regulator